jgi:hypothetical protein
MGSKAVLSFESQLIFQHTTEDSTLSHKIMCSNLVLFITFRGTQQFAQNFPRFSLFYLHKIPYKINDLSKPNRALGVSN